MRKNHNIIIAQSKLENRETKQGLDSFFLTNYEVERRPCIAVEEACIAIENTDEELVYLENLDSSVDVNISVENPDGESAFASDYLKGQLESYTNHLVTMKSFFMNEIYNLRKEMNDMKDEIQNGNKGNEKSNTLSNVDLITTLKTQNSFLEQENLFIKSKLKHQQKIIDKLLDIRSDNCSDQLKSNQSVKEYKKDFNKIKLDDRKELKDTGKPEQNK